jgi:hypothetical protein
MKYKIYLVFLFVLCSSVLKAQNLNSDSVAVKFERCIEDYLRINYIKHDSAFICYYGNKYDYSIKQVLMDDSDISFEDWPSVPIDSIAARKEGKQPFFYRGQNFMELLNVIVSRAKNVECRLPILNGTIFFINCPSEMWELFYFDNLIYGNNLYLTPTIDIIKSSASEKIHKREILVCKYSDKDGFKIDQVVLVRDSKDCK